MHAGRSVLSPDLMVLPTDIFLSAYPSTLSWTVIKGKWVWNQIIVVFEISCISKLEEAFDREEGYVFGICWGLNWCCSYGTLQI